MNKAPLPKYALGEEVYFINNENDDLEIIKSSIDEICINHYRVQYGLRYYKINEDYAFKNLDNLKKAALKSLEEKIDKIIAEEFKEN